MLVLEVQIKLTGLDEKGKTRRSRVPGLAGVLGKAFD